MADPDAYTAAVKKGKVLLTAMKASPNSPVQHSQPSTWTSYNSFEKHGWKRDHSQEVEIYKDGVTTELAGIMRKHNVSIGSPNNIAICWQHHATTTVSEASVKGYFDATLVDQNQLYNIGSGTIIGWRS